MRAILEKNALTTVQISARLQLVCFSYYIARLFFPKLHCPPCDYTYINKIQRTLLVMCSEHSNGERGSLANLKLTIGSLLQCS